MPPTSAARLESETPSTTSNDTMTQAATSSNTSAAEEVKAVEPVDLDALPEYTSLRHTGLVVPRGQVFAKIRERYASIAELLANDAMPDTLLCGQIEDISTVAALADRGRLLARHDTEWSKVVSRAIRTAKQERDKISGLLEKLDRKEDIESFEKTIMKPAESRYSRATSFGTALGKLIEDLQERFEEE